MGQYKASATAKPNEWSPPLVPAGSLLSDFGANIIRSSSSEAASVQQLNEQCSTTHAAPAECVAGGLALAARRMQSW